MTAQRQALDAILAHLRRLDGRSVATTGIALIAGWASYKHQVKLATIAGEGAAIAHALPITVDALVIVCLIGIRRATTRPALIANWFGFVLGLGASISANVLVAQPELLAAHKVALARSVSAWPIVCLVAIEAVRMTDRTTRPVARRKVASVSPPPVLASPSPTVTPARVATVRPSAAAGQGGGGRRPAPAASSTSSAPATRGKTSPVDAEQLRRLAAEHPDWTQAELGAAAGCSERTVRRHLGPAEAPTGPTPADTSPDAGEAPGGPEGAAGDELDQLLDELTATPAAAMNGAHA